MSSTTHDQLGVLYSTLLVFATVGVVILALGLIEFAYFERPGQASGIHARIVGVYRYENGRTIGTDRIEFRRTEQFAAVVDWSALPDNLIVDARWYDAFGTIEGHVGPASGSELANSSVVPVAVPAGYRYVLPGRYMFVVERFNEGVPVEVLARRFELVDRT